MPTSREDVVERQHVMPGDPPDIMTIALQWYVNFDWGAPHTSRESNMAVEGFKDGYRAALSAGTASCDEGAREALRIVERSVAQYDAGDVPKGTVGIWLFLPQWKALLSALPRADTGTIEALREARDAIASLDADALGMVIVPPEADGDTGYEYPIRDELLAKIDASLPPSGQAPEQGMDGTAGELREG